jgi:flagellar P-ring protein FlgI
VRDLVDFDGVRGNDLVGYGLVVGLDGRRFAAQFALHRRDPVERPRTPRRQRDRRTAPLPQRRRRLRDGELRPFARAGSRIDLTVSAIGDAKSLLGGTLVMTPLKAADGLIYAVGQGTVIAGGARAEGEAAEVVEGVPTSGAIPSGARVEREVPFVFNDLHSIRLALRNPDFTTAERIERAINDAYGARVSQMLDSGTVLLNVRATREPTPAHAMGRIENLTVEPQSWRAWWSTSAPARSFSARTSGSPASRSRRGPRASRGGAARGRPAEPLRAGRHGRRPPHRGRTGRGDGRGLVEVSGDTSLREVIDGLNALGVSPQDMIDILQTIQPARSTRSSSRWRTSRAVVR